MQDARMTIQALREQVGVFVRERDWEQFHSPKELAAAIAIEAAELMEIFLWQTPTAVEQAIEQPETAMRTAEELADVLILCLSMANRLGLDISTTVLDKLQANARKYPVHLAHGSARKYTEYQPG